MEVISFRHRLYLACVFPPFIRVSFWHQAGSTSSSFVTASVTLTFSSISDFHWTVKSGPFPLPTKAQAFFVITIQSIDHNFSRETDGRLHDKIFLVFYRTEKLTTTFTLRIGRHCFLRWTSWIVPPSSCSSSSVFALILVLDSRARAGAVGWGTALQAGRSRVQFPMVSLDFFIDIILPATLCSWSQIFSGG